MRTVVSEVCDSDVTQQHRTKIRAKQSYFSAVLLHIFQLFPPGSEKAGSSMWLKSALGTSVHFHLKCINCLKKLRCCHPSSWERTEACSERGSFGHEDRQKCRGMKWPKWIDLLHLNQYRTFNIPLGLSSRVCISGCIQGNMLEKGWHPR